MALDIKTSIRIKATPTKVWEILTDFESYPNWNPFIKSIKGQVEQGHTITARIEPPESKGMTFKPVILVFAEHQELKWLGKLLFKGLFDGEHQFLITDNGDGTVLFEQNEHFTGILVGLFAKNLNQNTRRGFEAMNEQLKFLAEKKD